VNDRSRTAEWRAGESDENNNDFFEKNKYCNCALLHNDILFICIVTVFEYRDFLPNLSVILLRDVIE